MRTSRWLMGGLLLLTVVSLLLDQQTTLEGCAPAPHPGQWVDIRDESALIVWDAASKTEHFIRRASFETAADDFGFLVPTPTQPDLGEAEDWTFETLGQQTAARHVYQTKVETVFGFGSLLPETHDKSMAVGAAPNAEPRAAVEVLDEKHVAGFDATVLKASDAQALAEWLDKHGYEARPALTEWLKWYVDHEWIITAFKLTKGQQPSFEAKSVRMSFRSDRPFYPYREPADMRNPSGQGSRTLRVFFLSDQRYEGRLGESGSWPATDPWAGSISDYSLSLLGQQLKLEPGDAAKLPDGVRHLTEFEDRSFPRPGTDEVYFSPAADQSAKKRPPIVHTTTVVQYWPGPWGAVALAIGLPVLAALALRRWLIRKPTA